MEAQSPRGRRGRENGRRIPMRLWLGAAFAGVSLITAASVYVFVDDSSGRTLQSQSADLAVGKTSSLADELGKARQAARRRMSWSSPTPGTSRPGLSTVTATPSRPARTWPGWARCPRSREVLRVALDNRRYRASLPGNVTVAAAPIFGNRDVPVRGAVIVRADPPPALTRAFDRPPRRPAPGPADRDRDRRPGRLPGLLADRDPGASGSPGRPSRWRPGNSMRLCRRLAATRSAT